MTGELLYGKSELAIFLGFLFSLILAGEGGYWLGRRKRHSFEEATKPQFSTIQGSVLGLLALLLAFTFGMAQSRFEFRQREVLEESNAIGTAYLRTRLLPELYRTDAANLLRQYVDARLEFYEARMDSTKLSAAIGTSEQVQRKLWSQAIAASAQDPRSVSIALYLQSLNEVIDVHSKRVAAFRNRVPEIVLVLLLAVGILAMAVTGYGWAQGNRPHRLLTGILSILIALVVLVIMDLDRPRRGLIRVSQQSMIDLRDSLNEASP
jgi:uncharacterized membrane protein SirB2